MDDKNKVKKEVQKEIDGSIGPPPRKGGLKFAPKVPPKKTAKIVPKKEPVEESKDEAIDKELLMKLKASQTTGPFARRVKDEEKPKSRNQVAFGQGNVSYARSFAKPKSSSDDASKLRKEYAEPWDYTNTDYPVTLPLRRPYSGDPEILDEQEFGGSSSSRAEDAELTAADELGLMERSDEPKLLFFQMPSSLPLPKQPQSAAAPNKSSEENAGMKPTLLSGSTLKELPGGYMGKILVYRSGKVKMKMGDTLFDVSAGSNCMFVQEIAAVNARQKHCCTLGELGKRAVVIPDVGHLLGSGDRMEE